tara:strand:- start:80 stop:283 length:204 start_codon:yes stop_codon:yes gene_type:complete
VTTTKTAGANALTVGLKVDYTANYVKIATVKCLRPFGQVMMMIFEIVIFLLFAFSFIVSFCEAFEVW